MSKTRPDGRNRAAVDFTARDTLVGAINEEEAHLRRLETEQAEAKARLEALRVELAALDEEREVPVRSRSSELPGSAPRTPYGAKTRPTENASKTT